MIQYFLEITSDAGRYRGRLHRGDPANARSLPQLALGPDDVITIRAKTYTLGQLIEALIDFDAGMLETLFDERGQWELGHYLYAQIFGDAERTGPAPSTEAEALLRIVTEDEPILRLPWVLLARDGVFLAATGWSVMLGGSKPVSDVLLPPSPRLLVAIPQAAGTPDTEAEAHLEELEDQLSQADHHFYRGRRLHVARTWEELTAQVAAHHFDVLYYYGHGVGDRQRSRLVFATGKEHRREDVPIADLVACLRRSPGGPPLLAYVNCCQGDAGGVLGAGRQLLSGGVPAVVTNRTVAYIDAARRQALAFWQATLLEGAPPHAAVANLYAQVGDDGLTFKNTRWLTPVLHGGYQRWQASPPKARNRLDRDPHWRVKVDRVNQFGRVAYETGEMLRRHNPRSLAYVWYGQEGQGVDLFHQRLKVELRDMLDAEFYELRPHWPDDLHQATRSFEDMLLAAFEVSSLDAVPDRIRAQSRGETDRQVLVYLRHAPVLPGDPIKPQDLREYLDWWDRYLAPSLPPNAFGLLSVSFVVGKPPKFRDVLEKRVNDLEMRCTLLHILDEMERLARKDLQDFLKKHDILLPANRRERIIDKVLAETGGHYELTLEALKAMVEQAWDLEDEGSGQDQSGEDEDYN